MSASNIGAGYAAAARSQSWFAGIRRRALNADASVVSTAMPVLIILIIAMMTLVLANWLLSERSEHKTQAHQDLSLMADSSYLAVLEAINSGFEPTNARDFENILARGLPANATEHGRVFLVLTQGGLVIGHRGGNDAWLMKSVSALMDGETALTMFGRQAGPQTVMFQGVSHIAAMARTGPDGHAVMVLQSHGDVFSRWNRMVSILVTVFAALVTPLITLLSSYHIQSARADEARMMFFQAQKRVETALSRGSCGLWDWDLARGRVHWSRSMYEMLGYRPSSGEMSIGDVMSLVHPNDADLFEIAKKAVQHEIERVDELLRMRHANGTFVWMRIRTEVLEQSPNGAHMIGIAVDVTENHRLASESAAASQRLEAAIENTAESFALWDAQDRLVMANSRFLEFSGLDKNDVKPGMHRQQIEARMRKPISERSVLPAGGQFGEARTVERMLVDERWVQVSEKTTREGGTISIGTDITQVKNHEHQLEKNERLLMSTVEQLEAERRVSSQKAEALEKANTDVVDAKNRAEAAYRTKSEFLANMSHELRTPLNAIIGFSDMMRQTMFGPLGNGKYADYANDIYSSGSYLMSVVNDILEMSKIEAGRMVLERENIDLQPLVSEAVQMLSVEADKKGIEVDYEIDTALTINADRRAMKQTLLNLISNAVKFTDEGGRVRVRAKAFDTAVQITIGDTGCGIPRTAIARIGLPFEQVQSQLSKNHKGTGLGLAIARSIVELHNGSFRIKSTEGIGTTVSIRIPKLAA